jgi:hypothetical protein
MPLVASAGKRAAHAVTAVGLGVLLSACTLLIDRDSLSSEFSKAGSDGASGAGNIGGECAPEVDDIYCDGLDLNCEATDEDVGCPAGCTGTTVNGVSYMACSISSSFEQAETRCQGQAMQLLRIDGGAENELAMELARTIGSYVWIGGSNLADEAKFEWTDGTVFYESGAPLPGVYQNFGPDQPVSDPERRCVQLHDSTGFWSNAPCSDTLQFICGR